MATAAPVLSTPASREELAAELRAAGEDGTAVRVRGAGTKLAWAGGAPVGLELCTAGLDRIVEHNPGDLTAVVEAGVPLARAQAAFAEQGQMIALDPPGAEATIGGVVATADSGPLRARYGGVRDLVIGVQVALSDGTIAKAGGKVIKNVAGYDLAKLFAGSFGTLGAILEVSVRLHPLPPATATALGRSSDPGELAAAARELAHAPLEALGLDVRWAPGQGMVLARFGGVTPWPQAQGAERLLRAAGLHTEVVDDDDELWRAQREGQRSAGGLAVRVPALQTELADLLRTAERHDAELVGRAGLGLTWLRHEGDSPQALLDELRRSYVAVVLDRPPGLGVDGRGAAAGHGPLDARHPAAGALMQRVKERFDPAGVLVA